MSDSVTVSEVQQILVREHERLRAIMTKPETPGHYKHMPMQPIDYITSNKMPFIEGNIVKYISRWRDKGGVEDLRKIIHYVQLLAKAEGLEL